MRRKRGHAHLLPFALLSSLPTHLPSIGAKKLRVYKKYIGTYFLPKKDMDAFETNENQATNFIQNQYFTLAFRLLNKKTTFEKNIVQHVENLLQQREPEFMVKAFFIFLFFLFFLSLQFSIISANY